MTDLDKHLPMLDIDEQKDYTKLPRAAEKAVRDLMEEFKYSPQSAVHEEDVWKVIQELHIATGGRDHLEDAKELDNGSYQSRCCMCRCLFLGHKRRVACKVCEDKS